MSSPRFQSHKSPLTDVTAERSLAENQQQRLRVLPNQPLSDTDPEELVADLDAVWPEIESSIQYLRDR